MEYTTKWKLSKPTYDDDVDIQVLNNNFDIIDGKLQTVSVSDNTLHVDDKSYPLNYMPIAGGNFTGDITVKNVAPMYVVEEGSSEQYGAKYIKYSNGTMIQMFFYYPDTISRKFIDVTFLQPFAEPPIILGNRDKRSQMPGSTREDLYNFTFEVAFSNITTTGFKASVDDSLGASVFVWGRWK